MVPTVEGGLEQALQLAESERPRVTAERLASLAG
jgi:hypothetical protein